MTIMTLQEKQPDDGAVTMTSLELVQFINNQRDAGAAELAHSDFLKKVPQVLGSDAGNFSSVYLGGNGQERPCYSFHKREACLMAMSYSYDLQAKVFDRMTALESRPALSPANFSRMQLIEMAMQAEQERMESEQKRLALETVVADQAPKVQAFDRISTFSDGCYGVREVAKMLDMQEKHLKQKLQEFHWFYRHPMGKSWLGYDSVRKKGYVEHKRSEGDKPDGGRWESVDAKITAKGLLKLAELLGKELEAA